MMGARNRVGASVFTEDRVEKRAETVREAMDSWFWRCDWYLTRSLVLLGGSSRVWNRRSVGFLKRLPDDLLSSLNRSSLAP